MDNDFVTIVMRRRFMCAAYMYKRNLRNRQRRWWVRPINANRLQQGDWEHLINEMRLSDPEMFFNYTRLTIQQFDYLLSLVGPHIKKSNLRRQPISEGARLALTLRHLATGDSIPSLCFSYRIGKSTACGIIKETCDAMWNVLQKYVQFPTEDEWIPIAAEFQEQWNLPNCIGAIDGKHIVIKAPNNSGSTFYNYKKSFSIVLFAICNANYEFIYVDVGAYGSQSDGGVLRESVFGNRLFNNQLGLPEDVNLPNTNVSVPYFFVGDEAFPLVKHLFRPYGGRFLSRDKRIFNYRLSRARRCIENAFGIMVARFRIFHRVINAYPQTADSIVKACVCLHNFIKKLERNMDNQERRYCPPNYIDQNDDVGNMIPGEWRNNVPGNSALRSAAQLQRRIGARNASRNANIIRETYKDYVNSVPGQVPWQQNVI